MEVISTWIEEESLGDNEGGGERRLRCASASSALFTRTHTPTHPHTHTPTHTNTFVFPRRGVSSNYPGIIPQNCPISRKLNSTFHSAPLCKPAHT